MVHRVHRVHKFVQSLWSAILTQERPKVGVWGELEAWVTHQRSPRPLPGTEMLSTRPREQARVRHRAGSGRVRSASASGGLHVTVRAVSVASRLF